MKNIKKYLCILLAMMMMGTALSGCKGKTTSVNDIGDYTVSTPTPNQGESDTGKGESTEGEELGGSKGEKKLSPEEAEKEIQKIIEGIGKEDEPSITTNEEGEVKTPSSDDWNTFNFTLDGHEFKLPANYEAFKATGWEIDLNYMGYPDGYVLNTKQKTTSTVDVFHAKYRTLDNKYDMSLNVGFFNSASQVQDITKCDIWALDLDVQRLISNKKECPKLVLAKGITWGSSKEEIEKAYGAPKDTYRAEELKYWEYTYESSDYNKMRLTIYDDTGLVEVSIQNWAATY